MRPLKFFAMLATAATLWACATPPPAPVPIAQMAARTPQLATLSRLIADAGLADTLRGSGPFTLFAPSDDAFKAIPSATLAELGRDKARLKEVLDYHLLPARMPAAEIRNGSAKTVQGATLALSRSGSFVAVEDAVVTQADLAASNGVVHVIDRVLLPPRR